MKIINPLLQASRLCAWEVTDYKKAMTRPQIERSIKIFIIALIVTFVWTVTKVLELVGVM